jgi:hypothetical protein
MNGMLKAEMIKSVEEMEQASSAAVAEVKTLAHKIDEKAIASEHNVEEVIADAVEKTETGVWGLRTDH